MCAYSRLVHVGLLLVVLFELNESLLDNVTVVECEINGCTITCHNGTYPYVWMFIASYKDTWGILPGLDSQTITLSENMSGYYHCIDGGNHPSKIFYFVGKKVPPDSSSGVLTAVIVLAVLFGIGFLIMVALASFKFYKGRLAKSFGDGVTIRENPKQRTSYNEVNRSMQPSVDDDGYVVPLNPENRDSDYLEVLPNHSTTTRTLHSGPLYENLENIRRARN